MKPVPSIWRNPEHIYKLFIVGRKILKAINNFNKSLTHIKSVDYHKWRHASYIFIEFLFASGKEKLGFLQEGEVVIGGVEKAKVTRQKKKNKRKKMSAN